MTQTDLLCGFIVCKDTKKFPNLKTFYLEFNFVKLCHFSCQFQFFFQYLIVTK